MARPPRPGPLLSAVQRVQYRLLGAERQLQSRHRAAIAQGPLLAVRRTALDQVWDDYAAGGRRPGDDLELSLLLLERGGQVVREPHAKAATQPKATWRGYQRQQLRWDRSWYREWPRIRRQLTGHSLPLDAVTWARWLPVTPRRVLALATRHRDGWGGRRP